MTFVTGIKTRVNKYYLAYLNQFIMWAIDIT